MIDPERFKNPPIPEHTWESWVRVCDTHRREWLGLIVRHPWPSCAFEVAAQLAGNGGDGARVQSSNVPIGARSEGRYLLGPYNPVVVTWKTCPLDGFPVTKPKIQAPG